MSGGEVLGVLGLLGLLSTCREVFDLVCEARDAGDRAQKWYGKVELQKFHFQQWCRQFGLDPLECNDKGGIKSNDDNDDSSDDDSEIEEAVKDKDKDPRPTESEKLAKLLNGEKGKVAWRQVGIILKTLSDINDLQSRYNLPEAATPLQGQRPDTIQCTFTSQDDFTKAIAQSKERLLARVRETQKSLSAWKKTRWVFRDEQKMARCCQDLEDANEALRSLMAEADKEALVRGVVTEIQAMLAHTPLQINLMNSSVICGVHEPHTTSAPASCPGLMLAVNEDSRLSKAVVPLVQVERMTSLVPQREQGLGMEIPETDYFERYTEHYRLEIPLEQTKDVLNEAILDLSESRGMTQILKPGCEEPLTVYAEVRRQGSNDETYFKEANLELASLLHAASCSTDSTEPVSGQFIGFVPNTGRTRDGAKFDAAVFCFQVPKAPGITSDINSGPFQSLSERIKTPNALPRLETRFRIAQLLARQYYNFVETGWLHKGIRSSNILFWGRVYSNELDWWPHLFGYGYARAGVMQVPQASSRKSRLQESSDKERFPRYNLDDVTEEQAVLYYLHPLYRRAILSTRYDLTYDLYSLAIILIELAGWTAIGPNFRAPNVVRTGFLLAQEQKVLQFLVGTKYTNAVQALLDGTIVSNPWGRPSTATISRRFSELVLKPLEECCA